MTKRESMSEATAAPVTCADSFAGAQNCGHMLAPGGLRVGYVYNSSGHMSWMHLECMSAARWRTAALVLQGLCGLAPHDRARPPPPSPQPYIQWRA